MFRKSNTKWLKFLRISKRSQKARNVSVSKTKKTKLPASKWTSETRKPTQNLLSNWKIIQTPKWPWSWRSRRMRIARSSSLASRSQRSRNDFLQWWKTFMKTKVQDSKWAISQQRSKAILLRASLSRWRSLKSLSSPKTKSRSHS